MPITTTVITGATSGIGYETALALAKKDHAIYMLVRDIEKGENAKQEIIRLSGNTSVFVIKCDLADLQSVRAAADELKARLFNINVLINNAGGMFNTRQVSKNGFEMTFAVNHLAHFLLTMCLMPLLEKGHARIINLSSEGHKLGNPNFADLQMEHNYSATKAYGNAKLFNIYFTKSLAERYADKGIKAYAVHPGVVNTSFGSDATGIFKTLLWLARPFMITPAEGAKTSIYLATQTKPEPKSGEYFKKCKAAATSAKAKDQEARNKLWNLSEQFVKF